MAGYYLMVYHLYSIRMLYLSLKSIKITTNENVIMVAFHFARLHMVGYLEQLTVLYQNEAEMPTSKETKLKITNMSMLHLSCAFWKGKSGCGGGNGWSI